MYDKHLCTYNAIEYKDYIHYIQKRDRKSRAKI